MKKDVLTTFEAADFCHTSYMSVKRWIWAGKLDAFKTPGGHFRIDRNDLLEFMRKNGIPVSDDGHIERKRVLIVDGDTSVLEEVASYLRMNTSELDVAAADNGYETGIMVCRFCPDIILLDIVTPGLDGISICERLKKNPMTHDIRVIAITGSGNEESARQAYARGADKVLFKPVDMKDLCDHIREERKGKAEGKRHKA